MRRRNRPDVRRCHNGQLPMDVQCPVPALPRRSAIHGTYGGYQKHMRTDKQPCEPCRLAERAYHNRYRRLRRQLRPLPDPEVDRYRK